MLRSKQKELLDYLRNQHNPVLAIKLSQVLNVSTRTIKNYVVEINSAYNEKIIISGQAGYALSPDANIDQKHYYDKQVNNYFPKTFQERAAFLIKAILLFERSHNIYDLSADLYISDSTLKSLIYKINGSFQQFNIRFLCRNHHIEILGDEQDLRKLIYHIIMEEREYQFIDLKIFGRIFGGQHVDRVSAIISRVFNKWNYSYHNLSYTQLILHFLILINRLKNSRYLYNNDIFDGNTQLISMVDELCDNFQNDFGLLLSEQERHYCNRLLSINANFNHKRKDLQGNGVETGLDQLTKQIAASVQEHYSIDLSTHDFISLFSVHISGLKTRLAHKISAKNPMLETIKKECRTIFEIAIFISMKLNKLWREKLNEDEISFIALHVGAEFERQKIKDNKVQAVLLCPGFRGVEDKIYHQLLTDFGNELYVIKVISQPAELEGLACELLITTINLPANYQYETVYISPFQLRNKYAQLMGKIDAVNARRKKETLQRNFELFFEHGLFWFEPGFQHRNELIDALCQAMNTKGYVGADFIKCVYERENASSTAFGMLALPHSVKPDAIKTGAAVVISPKGIRWGKNERVHVVFLIAINRIDRGCFAECSDALLNIFNQGKMLNQLHKITGFEKFRQTVMASGEFTMTGSKN
ncbi:MAG: PRD domain-containing protein [Enterobacteriaceae bacterium]|jgi:lichenan operon transcriptional antiterminator|nr:PRD domain-containing protein [Enterobacteriaceae bacterium]